MLLILVLKPFIKTNSYLQTLAHKYTFIVEDSTQNICGFLGFFNVGNLDSDYFAFSKSSLNIGKFLVHVLLKPSLKDFEHYFTSV